MVVFLCFTYFLTAWAGFRRPRSGSVFSGSGGKMARRNRPSYSWVKIYDFVVRQVNTAKIRKTSALGSLTHPSLLSAHAGIYMPSGRARGGSGPCIGGGTPHSDDVAADTFIRQLIHMWEWGYTRTGEWGNGGNIAAAGGVDQEFVSMVHYVPRNSSGTPQFLIRGSEGVGWGGAGWDVSFL